MNSNEKKTSTYNRVKKNFYAHLEEGNSALSYFENIIETRTWGTFRTLSKSLKDLSEELKEDKIISDEELNTIFESIKERQKVKNPKATIKIDELIDFMVTIFKNCSSKNHREEVIESSRDLVALFLAIPIMHYEDFKFFEEFTKDSIQRKVKIKDSFAISWKNKERSRSVLIKKHSGLYLELLDAYTEGLSSSDAIFKDFLKPTGGIKFYSQLNDTYSDLLMNFLEDDTNITSPIKIVTEIKKSLKDKGLLFFSPL